MNNTGKILLIGGAATALVIGVVHVAKTSDTADKIDLHLENFGIKKQGISGIGAIKLPGKVVFKADIKASNPTGNDLIISKPYLKVFYRNIQIGNSNASGETINLKAKDVTYINDVDVEFHALDVLPIMPDFLKYIADRFTGKLSTRKVRVDILTTANGISTTQTKEVSI
ncbi:MAG: hypothetical protein WAQ28_13600 [Bacteroidia bacterium]